MSQNLFDYLMESGDQNKKALVVEGRKPVTYGELERASAKYANALERMGIKTGDRIAVQAEKSATLIVLYLACVRLGAVYLPLNPAYTTIEVVRILVDAEPALFICDPSASRLLQREGLMGGVRCMTLDANGDGTMASAALDQSEQYRQKAGPADLAAILYTSGTTGRAKGAMLSHENLIENARALRQAWGFHSADRLIHALPLFHAHGLFISTNVALASGATVLLLPRFDPDAIIDMMPTATCLMGVPTFFSRLLNSPRLSRDSARHMRLFISGSAPLLAETHRAWEARTGHSILERYGLTETGINTSNPYEGKRIAGSVGLPLSNVELRLTALSTGKAVESGEVGQIEVRGPNVFKGYWNDPAKSASQFIDGGYFQTGDLGRFDDKGYLTIVGRIKDLIISGGYNIYPKELEMEIDAIPDVVESAVVGLPHPDFGEAVTAFVIRQEGVVSETDIGDFLRRRIAKYKVPKQVIFVEELPRNAMGKVQKNVLREEHQALYQPGS